MILCYAKVEKKAKLLCSEAHEVYIDETGTARLTETGGISGSTMRMNDGLRNLVEKAMVPFETAINSCTTNPAKLLGLQNRLGKIAVSYDADIVVLKDNFDVLQTYVKGVPQL